MYWFEISDQNGSYSSQTAMVAMIASQATVLRAAPSSELLSRSNQSVSNPTAIPSRPIE